MSFSPGGSSRYLLGAITFLLAASAAAASHAQDRSSFDPQEAQSKPSESRSAGGKNAATQPAPAGQESSFLQFRIGSAYITPTGFMDLTGVFRTTAPGTGIGTNFGSIPYGNTIPGKLTELRLSAQNSRIGARVDAKVKGAQVTAYWESDFLGFTPANTAVSSNGVGLRLRLYWVDLSRGRWEVLGGQSWSLITPGRKGISPFPGDLFHSQVIDVNYQLGLTWSRDPQVRFVYHPSEAVAMGVSLESPEQYMGGSAGGGLITLPSALAAPYATQLNNAGTAFNAPGLHPDIVAKMAWDPKPRRGALHFEIGGTARTFRVFDPLNSRHFTAAGLGGEANLSIELFKGFRLFSNNYWSDGGGRWVFGQAPDLIVRGDGSLSSLHSSSAVCGLEVTSEKILVYAYYGGVYIGRDVSIDEVTGKFVGYGYPGAPDSQNRSIQETTFGLTRTFWKDARYGALSLMGQYSYVVRHPWAVAAGQPGKASTNMVFVNLRYALPGAAPALK